MVDLRERIQGQGRIALAEDGASRYEGRFPVWVDELWGSMLAFCIIGAVTVGGVGAYVLPWWCEATGVRASLLSVVAFATPLSVLVLLNHWTGFAKKAAKHERRAMHYRTRARVARFLRTASASNRTSRVSKARKQVDKLRRGLADRTCGQDIEEMINEFERRIV